MSQEWTPEERSLPELFRELYWQEGLSLREMAKKLRMDGSLIYRLMKKHDIKRRTKSEARKLVWAKGCYNDLWRARLSNAHVREINLTPTRNLGYFCGMVLGDGYLNFYSTRKGRKIWQIRLNTTKKFWADIFITTASNVFPMFKPFIYSHMHERTFPNGTTRTDKMWVGVLASKRVYEALRPFKKDDYCWEIPKFLTSQESLAGFIAGIFDAEGNAGERSIAIFSKHTANLSPLKDILVNFGIQSSLQKGALRISGRENLRKFLKYCEPKIEYKKNKIASYLSRQERPFKHWTVEEDQIILAKYSKVPLEDLAKIMNRSYWSVLNRARRLKIKEGLIGQGKIQLSFAH